MSNVAKLKKKAAEFELKKDFAKALAVYVEILDNFDQHAAELDVSLFNRVGDLMLRQGNVADAVDYYERAVVRYVDGGFYNNAIALCNKILRHSPGRASVYYTLGKISAHKGFTTDAKQNFLEYADRMQKAGKLDEAFRALKEFADLCPGQDDIRLMLADQLSKLNRKDEAIEQLQTLWARYHGEGRAADAAAIVQRMKAIDPAAQPREGAGKTESRPGDLVFLDLGEAPPARPGGGPRQPPRSQSRAAPPAVADLPLLDSGFDEEEEQKPPPKPVPAPPKTIGPPRRPAAAPPQKPRPAAARDEPAPPEDGGALAGLEPTSFEGGRDPDGPTSILDIEPTGFAPPHVVDENLIEPEASATLLPDSEMLDPGSPSAGPQKISGVQPPTPDVDPFDFHPNAALGVDGISHDSASMDLDLRPAESVGEENANYWQSSEVSPFDIGGSLLGEVPPLLRSDAIGLDDPLAQGGGTGSDNGASSSSLIDFDTSSLEAAGLGSFGVGAPAERGPKGLRRHTASAKRSVSTLQSSVEDEPENWALRRELAEAMLESGDKEGGVRELETAMIGAERANELDLASSLAEEIARLAPDTVRIHQKRVEYAFRTNDKLRLIEAYLALAGALLNAQQAEKARAVYQRVLDLAPDDIRAQAALESLAEVDPPPPEPPPPSRKGGPRAPSGPPSTSPVRTRGADPVPTPGDGGFV